MHFYKLKKLFSSLLSANNVPDDFIEIRVYDSYYSVLIIGRLLCTLKLDGKIRYIAFPLEYIYLFEDKFKIDRIYGSIKRFRITIFDTDDIEKLSHQVVTIASALLNR